jgi:hypothetical protein
VFVEVRHTKSAAIGSALLRQFVEDIDRYRLQLPSARGILIFSGDISASGAAGNGRLSRN